MLYPRASFRSCALWLFHLVLGCFDFILLARMRREAMCDYSDDSWEVSRCARGPMLACVRGAFLSYTVPLSSGFVSAFCLVGSSA